MFCKEVELSVVFLVYIVLSFWHDIQPEKERITGLVTLTWACEKRSEVLTILIFFKLVANRSIYCLLLLSIDCPKYVCKTSANSELGNVVQKVSNFQVYEMYQSGAWLLTGH